MEIKYRNSDSKLDVIDINPQLILLWGINHGHEQHYYLHDFLHDHDAITDLSNYTQELHKEYMINNLGCKTFSAYFETKVLIEVENRLREQASLNKERGE